MDNLHGKDLRDEADDYDFAPIETPPIVSLNERRLNVRAYDYWTSLLGDRRFPSIEDLNPSDLEDFSPYSVLLDFSMGLENPAIIYLGSALREECGIEGRIEYVSEVPPRSLLSRLTDHYMQIQANEAPIGFEAEFLNQRGAEILYRGILMPFSSDDESIDFIYGVISWKEAASAQISEALSAEISSAWAATHQGDAPVWADGPAAASPAADAPTDGEDRGAAPVRAAFEEELLLDASMEFLPGESRPVDEAGRDDAPPAGTGIAAAPEDDLEMLPDMDEDEGDAGLADLSALFDDTMNFNDAATEAPGPSDDEDFGLDEAAADTDGPHVEAQPQPQVQAEDTDIAAMDFGADDAEEQAEHQLAVALNRARSSAAEAAACDARTRTALYAALGDAYDFALAAREDAEGYAALLDVQGIAVQERSPMTAVAKLVFGTAYDKTRLSEYALAIEHAFAHSLPQGAFAAHLTDYPGGLKGVVAEMRAARRAGAPARSAGYERARSRLARMAPIAAEELPLDADGMAVAVVRREADGSISLLGAIGMEEKTARQVMVKASRSRRKTR